MVLGQNGVALRVWATKFSLGYKINQCTNPQIKEYFDPWIILKTNKPVEFDIIKILSFGLLVTRVVYLVIGQTY